MNFLDFYLQQITLIDLIDIFIVSIIFYRVLLFIQGTKVIQMLSGIGALLILFWLGLSYKLPSVNWLLSRFFDSFFILAVVLFQDQIRSALASIGGAKKIFSGLSKVRQKEYREEIIEAVFSLAKNKIGTILAIENTHDLSKYMATGTKIEGKISSALIYSIFSSSSPLHDGAVIISEGEIKAAGCFLPLSNKNIDSKWGARHRAAVGLGKATDALIITVSEETGKIHVCIDGRLYPCDGKKDLRQHFKALISKKYPQKKLRPVKVFGD